MLQHPTSMKTRYWCWYFILVCKTNKCTVVTNSGMTYIKSFYCSNINFEAEPYGNIYKQIKMVYIMPEAVILQLGVRMLQRVTNNLEANHAHSHD